MNYTPRPPTPMALTDRQSFSKASDVGIDDLRRAKTLAEAELKCPGRERTSAPPFFSFAHTAIQGRRRAFQGRQETRA